MRIVRYRGWIRIIAVVALGQCRGRKWWCLSSMQGEGRADYLHLQDCQGEASVAVKAPRDRCSNLSHLAMKLSGKEIADLFESNNRWQCAIKTKTTKAQFLHQVTKALLSCQMRLDKITKWLGHGREEERFAWRCWRRSRCPQFHQPPQDSKSFKRMIVTNIRKKIVFLKLNSRVETKQSHQTKKAAPVVTEKLRKVRSGHNWKRLFAFDNATLFLKEL